MTNIVNDLFTERDRLRTAGDALAARLTTYDFRDEDLATWAAVRAGDPKPNQILVQVGEPGDALWEDLVPLDRVRKDDRVDALASDWVTRKLERRIARWRLGRLSIEFHWRQK